jgi:hypothetical protein
MNALMIFAVLLIVLFALAYVTKRRFGVMGLALCAGAVLSAGWATTLTPWVAAQGITFVSPPLSAVVAALLTLLPAGLLLFSGPTYNGKLLRIAGSAAFALLAAVFLLGPLGEALVWDSASAQVYQFLTNSGNVIVVVGIIAAIADILMTQSSKHRKK